jgi:hypothetical protein
MAQHFPVSMIKLKGLAYKYRLHHLHLFFKKIKKQIKDASFTPFKKKTN